MKKRKVKYLDALKAIRVAKDWWNSLTIKESYNYIHKHNIVGLDTLLGITGIQIVNIYKIEIDNNGQVRCPAGETMHTYNFESQVGDNVIYINRLKVNNT